MPVAGPQRRIEVALRYRGAAVASEAVAAPEWAQVQALSPNAIKAARLARVLR